MHDAWYGAAEASPQWMYTFVSGQSKSRKNHFTPSSGGDDRGSDWRRFWRATWLPALEFCALIIGVQMALGTAFVLGLGLATFSSAWLISAKLGGAPEPLQALPNRRIIACVVLVLGLALMILQFLPFRGGPIDGTLADVASAPTSLALPEDGPPKTAPQGGAATFSTDLGSEEGEREELSPEELTTPSPPTSSVTTPAPGIVPIDVSLHDYCPPPDPTDRQLPEVDICVVYWCKADVYDPETGELLADQLQIKLRPRLINNSSEPVRIEIASPSAMRLLVQGKDLDERWRPPVKTSAAGDTPILVEWHGAQYWAVPPNVPGDAQLTPYGFWDGFVTVWDGFMLEPGGSYFKPLTYQSNGRPRREGNLVFQLPTDDDGSVRLAGLAVVDVSGAEPRVIQVANADDWPPVVHPDSF